MNRCVYCSKKLGENHLLPEFPVGSRLAFDPANARLWAVCPKCERWNLSWLDERERTAAVARLDQYFVATPNKTESAGIGLAEVANTSLVRIGAVPWSTFASWRYARRLWARRRGSIINALIFWPALLSLATPQGKVFLRSDAMGWVVMALSGFIIWFYVWHTVMRIALPSGMLARVRAEYARSAAIQVDQSGWRLFVKHEHGTSDLHGRDALRALALLLPHINADGAGRKQVGDAVALIERAGGPERFIDESLTVQRLGPGIQTLRSLPAILRVALEIAVNEEAEKGALRGDLAAIAIERDTARLVADAAYKLN